MKKILIQFFNIIFFHLFKLGICGQFPSEYVTAVVSGQALGGVFTAIIEIITITFSSDPKGSALIFFTIGNILLVVSLITYIIMSRTEFFKHFTADKSIMPKTSHAPLQRQQSTVNPLFRDVLNKMWLYGFTEWMVYISVVTLSNLNSDLFKIIKILSLLSGVCCDIVSVSFCDSFDKFAIPW